MFIFVRQDSRLLFMRCTKMEQGSQAATVGSPFTFATLERIFRCDCLYCEFMLLML